MTPERKRLYSNVFYFPVNTNFKILRYLQQDKFEWLIKNSALYLCQVALFEDQLEGILPPFSMEYIKEFEEEIGMEFSQDKWDEIVRNLRESTFANCWHMNEEESVFMWKKYCPTKDGIFSGVLIESTFAQLENACDDPPEKYFLTMVEYVEDIISKFIHPGNTLHAFAHKDKSFEDEKEARILAFGKYQAKSIEMKINLDEMINAIYVHPCASQAYYDSVVELLKELAPVLVKKIKWSALRGKVDCKEFE